MQTLQQGSLLQGGRYKILSTLGQGGFGITYLAMQSGLERKVAIKEFFMKDLCNRDEATSHVSVGSTGSVDMVERFKAKFLKEARNMARLNHPNIVRIHDIFEENGTAYYVMEYAEGGSLADKVKRQGYIPESDAVRYIRQIADALGYIHMQKMNHLDVKPANIMLSEADDAILIDFGLSKQYDATTGNQTSTTPVGISDGYAPMEQYRPGGVGEFSPETDVYSLGATFFKLLTGVTPPSASDVNEDGVPVAELEKREVSQTSIDVISKAMEGRKKDRMKSVQEFIESLGVASPLNVPAPEPNPAAVDDEATVLNGQPSDASSNSTPTKEPKEKAPTENPKILKSKKQRTSSGVGYGLPVLLGVIIAIVVIVMSGRDNNAEALHPKTQELQSALVKTSSNKKTFTVNGKSFDMMQVTGGTFRMGATKSMDSEAYDDESPIHDVTLSDFYIGKTEVTQALWRAVMGSNPSYFKGENLPVECVNWNDCQEFIRKLNAKTGKTFRLPTEAEWEYAARGGNMNRGCKYSGSNNLSSVAWYAGNSSSRTYIVATKHANELGIYDMSGNVWEWCSDGYGTYGSKAKINPQGPKSGSHRVARGGSWCDDAECCRSAYRFNFMPNDKNDFVGFRLVLPV